MIAASVKWYTQSHRIRLPEFDKSDIEEETALGLAYFGVACAKLDYTHICKELITLNSMKDRLDKICELVHAVREKSKDEVS